MTPDLLLPAAFAAGFFGSTHCLSMCGAIVLLFEGAGQSVQGNWPRRIGYNIGRLSFYVLLGTIAGASGGVLASGFASGLGVLRVVAAILIFALGVNLIFDWRSLRFLESAGAVIWKRISPLARHVLPVSSVPHAVAAGFLWGALPCGLVYSAVALAATAGSAPAGGAVMLAFWAGTAPALIVAGSSVPEFSRWTKHRGIRWAAGVALIAIAVMSIALPLMQPEGHGEMQHGADVDNLPSAVGQSFADTLL